MLERLTHQDLEELVDLEKRVFDHPWKKEDFSYEINDNPFAKYYCIRVNQKIIAYIGTWLNEDRVEITNVGVDPNYRRLGFGKQLVSECLELMKNQGGRVFTLEVRETNLAAIGLYQYFGFEKVALRKNYYTDTHEDAYLMMMEVK